MSFWQDHVISALSSWTCGQSGVATWACGWSGDLGLHSEDRSISLRSLLLRTSLIMRCVWFVMPCRRLRLFSRGRSWSCQTDRSLDIFLRMDDQIRIIHPYIHFVISLFISIDINAFFFLNSLHLRVIPLVLQRHLSSIRSF